MLVATIHTLPLAPGIALLAFVLCGFWRGLSLRPHGPGHRPRPASKYFPWAQD